MRVLIAFERSGVVRDAFIAEGVDAYSCDLVPSKSPGPHIVGDAFQLISIDSWDLIIAHPECTYLSASGLHWNGRVPGRSEKTAMALEDIKKIWAAPVKHLCIENPVGCINSRIPSMPRPQYIQPYDFGADASKKTGLWLRGLPKLSIKREWRKAGRLVQHNGKMVERWGNQTDSGQNKLAPSSDRAANRAETYPEIARQMAAQWVRHLKESYSK